MDTEGEGQEAAESGKPEHKPDPFSHQVHIVHTKTLSPTKKRHGLPGVTINRASRVLAILTQLTK